MNSTMSLPIIILLVSLASGQWEPDVRLTCDDSASYTSANNCWCVAASGDTIHVVWADERDGGHSLQQIYYKRSCDGGTNWGPDVRLSSVQGQALGPAVAVVGSCVHVAWVETRQDDAEIYYRRSTDGGASFELECQVTDSSWECGDMEETGDANRFLVFVKATSSWIASAAFRLSSPRERETEGERRTRIAVGG